MKRHVLLIALLTCWALCKGTAWTNSQPNVFHVSIVSSIFKKILLFSVSFLLLMVELRLILWTGKMVFVVSCNTFITKFPWKYLQSQMKLHHQWLDFQSIELNWYSGCRIGNILLNKRWNNSIFSVSSFRIWILINIYFIRTKPKEMKTWIIHVECWKKALHQPN